MPQELQIEGKMGLTLFAIRKKNPNQILEIEKEEMDNKRVLALSLNVIENFLPVCLNTRAAFTFCWVAAMIHTLSLVWIYPEGIH